MIGYIFFTLFVLILIRLIIRKIGEITIFKNGRNPYHRVCKRCGSHQVMYQSNIEGMESHYWWEEVYPIGNNEKCKCHKYAEYHS